MNRKMVNTDRVVLYSVMAVLVFFVLACDSETLVGLVGNSKPLIATITEPMTGPQLEANERLALVVSAIDSKGGESHRVLGRRYALQFPE